MNKKEALIAMVNGEKVTGAAECNPDFYFQMNHNGIITDSRGRERNLSSLPDDNEFEIWKKPKKRITETQFLNIYPDGKHFVHKSEKMADEGCNGTRIACVPITFSYEVEDED